MGGAFGYINGSIPIRSLFALLASSMGVYYISKTHNIGKLASMGILIIFNALLLLGVCGGVGKNIFDKTWISFIAIAVFVFLPANVQAKTFNEFMTLFTVTLLPSLLFYILNLIGISIPYSILPSYEAIKSSAGIYYRHSFLSAQLINPVAVINRFNGIYFEAGILGTVSAMFLCVKKYSFRGKDKWREKILLVAGILSMSIAFILLSIIYFVSKNIASHNFKSVVALVAIMIIYSIAVSVPLRNPALANIQKRITVVDYSLQGDNRVSKKYDQVMEEYYASNFKTHLIGFGRGTFGKRQGKLNFDGSSYKSILYDYGMLGFALYVGWFILYGIKANIKFRIKLLDWLPVAIVQLANIYQNPAVFPIYFILIYSGGLAELYQRREKNAEVETV